VAVEAHAAAPAFATSTTSPPPQPTTPEDSL
jgi:hypothetical protein